MRAFLIAFVCLSTLAMAQNMVVVSPQASDAGVNEAVVRPTESARPQFGAPEAPQKHEARVPQASSMLMLVAGLSGLCAVGNRRHDRRRRQPS